MKKVNRKLSFVNIRKQTHSEEPVQAYAFQAETKDGITIDLFVYKHVERYGKSWLVNDDISNGIILPSDVRYTRKEAVQAARERIGKVTLQQVEEQRAKMAEIRRPLSAEEDASWREPNVRAALAELRAIIDGRETK